MRANSPRHHDTPTHVSRHSRTIGDTDQATRGETWRFEVEHQRAESVYLVQESAEGVSSWLPMRAVSPGNWELRHCVDRGHYRFRYYTAEGSLFINCGSIGLVAQRVSDIDSAVIIEPLDETGYAATG